MATLLTSNSYAANSGDNTTFRAYGTAVSNAFADAGWVQVDTNSAIDWATVVANGTVNTWVGSETWRMDDALQNTSPVYLKIDYGTLLSVNRGGFAVTLGRSSNGSGGLTGVFSTNTTLGMTPAGPNTYPCYFTGSSNNIMIGMWMGTTQPVVLSIERTHDANGADTAEGVLIAIGGYVGGFNGWSQQFWNFSTGASPVEDTVGVFMQKNTQAGRPPLFHWYPIWFSKGTFLNPSKNLILGMQAHFTPGCLSTVTHYGATHSYVGLDAAEFSNRSFVNASLTMILALWE